MEGFFSVMVGRYGLWEVELRKLLLRRLLHNRVIWLIMRDHISMV